MAARLKVFITSDGFTDYVVAASSRPKALAAWGVRQDVFREGRAHEIDDPELVKAATATPGAVLRRPAGSRGALAKVARKAPAKTARPDFAARRKVEALERRAAALAADQDRALGKLEAQRAALDDRIERLRADQAQARDTLAARLSATRRAPG